MNILTDLGSAKRCSIAFQKTLKFFFIVLTFALTSVLTYVLCSSQVSASVIFQDDFSRSNSNEPGANWISFESDENDIAIYNQQLRLRDYLSPEGTHVSLFVDANSFEDLSLSFSWRALTSTETSDSLVISSDVSSDTQNQILFSTGLGTAGTFSNSLSLTDSYVGWIGFWLNVNSSSEAVYIDDVMISGKLSTREDQVEALEVSEASSFALLCIGLIGLAGARRKRNTSATGNLGARV